MSINVLIIVPKDLNISDPVWQAENPEVAWELSNVVYEYTRDKAPGTHDGATTKVAHIITNTRAEDPLSYLQALLINYGLQDAGWEIIGLQSFGYEVPAVFDETDPENPILLEPAKALSFLATDTIKLFPYLAPRYTWLPGFPPVQGPELTKELGWMHVYGQPGDMAPWI